MTINTGVDGDLYSIEPSADGFDIVPQGVRNTENEDSMRLDLVCADDKRAEELSKRGQLQADLLADSFQARQFTHKLDAVYATNKTRTQQTVAPSADRANLDVIRLPAFLADGMTPTTELNPQSTTPSECATITAIQDARMNGWDTILIAGHSGTLYDIMGAGNSECNDLGLEISDDQRFPKNGVKVKNFGDIWKVVIRRNGEARFVYRKLLKPVKLKAVETVW